MSNFALTMVFINGDERQLRSLYKKMVRLEERKLPLIPNNFRDSRRWLGNLVYRLGGDYREIDCRGTWSCLNLSKSCLSFDCLTAWDAPFELLRLISRVYDGLHVYFAAEGDGWDECLTNDAEGVFFTKRYMLDTSVDCDYYDTIEEVSKLVSDYIGVTVGPTKEDVYEAIDQWETINTDIERYVNLKEFRVVEL